MIYVRTLGPPAVEVDGIPGPPELLWRKHLAVLVYLARSPRHTRSRDHLMNLLWGDRPEDAARHSLNEALRILRKHAGNDAVDSATGQVAVSMDAIRLDCDELARRVEQEDWPAAAELVIGEFLEGFTVPGASPFEEWLEAERGIWRRLGVEALTHHASQLLQAGHHGEAMRFARRAGTLDPWSALAIQTEMRALALAGHSATALERYAAWTDRLARDLDSAPDDTTRALADRIRGSIAGGSRHQAPVTEEHREWPLVGRDRELRKAMDTLAQCRSTPRASLLLVEGEAGSGKTRFLEAVGAAAALDGMTCVLARAVEGDRATDWSAACGLARGGLLAAPGAVGAPSEAFATLAALDPAVAEMVSTRPSPALPVPVALREILRSATDEGPVLLMLDDAQWLDPASLQGIESALRDLAAQPLTVLLAFRSTPAAPAIDDLRSRIGRDVGGAVIPLGALTVTALHELARLALPSYEPDELDRVVRRVSADSAGSPLLAGELLQAIAAGLDLGRLPEAWPAPSRTLSQTFPADLPDAVVAAVRVNFRRLKEKVRTALAAASVLPDRIIPAELAGAADMTMDELEPVLDELERQRWLVSDSRGYGFAARVVREVILRDMLTGGQRRRIEERVAQHQPLDPHLTPSRQPVTEP